MLSLPESCVMVVDNALENAVSLVEQGYISPSRKVRTQQHTPCPWTQGVHC
jgi:hypothetical protein